MYNRLHIVNPPRNQRPISRIGKIVYPKNNFVSKPTLASSFLRLPFGFGLAGMPSPWWSTSPSSSWSVGGLNSVPFRSLVRFHTSFVWCCFAHVVCLVLFRFISFRFVQFIISLASLVILWRHLLVHRDVIQRVIVTSFSRSSWCHLFGHYDVIHTFDGGNVSSAAPPHPHLVSLCLQTGYFRFDVLQHTQYTHHQIDRQT